MPTTDTSPHFENFAPLDESAVGVLVSGDSSTGKSNLMCGLINAVLRTNNRVVLLDPHGDLTDSIREQVESIATGGSNDRAAP